MKKLKTKIIGSKELERLEVLSKGGKIYTAKSGYSRGYGKWAKDNTYYYEQLLRLLDTNYIIGNDSFKGGLNTKFIKCRKFNFEKAKRKLEIEVIRKQTKEDCYDLYRNKFIENYFCQTSKSGKMYFANSKPYGKNNVAEMTARINGKDLEIYIGGEWKRCRKEP